MKWVLADHDASAAELLSRETGISPIIARLMVVRGISDPATARSFLASDLASLSPPSAFRDMEAAVARIRNAVSRREPILVYGDYDVDGVTGSSVLFLGLRELGAQVDCFIPDRMTDGYGLNAASLRSLHAAGKRLVITVDCGITAHREAALAREIGMDLIITDHHELSGPADREQPGAAALPPALAVLHPAILAAGVTAEDRERLSVLTGVGVAYKLLQAAQDAGGADVGLTKYLDLVTLGTIADMGRITGENRILVKEGLAMLSKDDQAQRPGIAALKQVAGLSGKRVTAGTVGFSLAPRINASGRLEKADKAFRLMTCDSPEEGLRIARELDEINRERQEVEEGIWYDARKLCLREPLEHTGAFVLASNEWHPGVIGIVASRIVEEFYRPAVLIALKDGLGKGSARSIPGFDLYHGLAQCADLLKSFGGHKCAAGLSIEENSIPLLRERLSGLVLERFRESGFVRTMTIDAPIALEDLTFDILKDLDRMAPFGQGNPEPRLGARDMEILSLRTVGSGNRHVKMRLRQNNAPPVDSIAYGKGDAYGRSLRPGNRIAAVFTPRINTWSGAGTIELDIRDIKVERN